MISLKKIYRGRKVDKRENTLMKEKGKKEADRGVNGVYEPKDEEEVLFPKYLAPDETIAIHRTDRYSSSRPKGKIYFKRGEVRIKRIKNFMDSKVYTCTFYFSLVSVSFLYALETPTMEPNHLIKRITFYADWVIWVIFFLDFLLKCYLRILRGRCKYIYLFSFFFDFGVLLTSIFYLLGNSNLAFARILRIFKVLMVIKKINVLNSIAEALLKSVKQIVSAAAFLVAFYFVFAILFVRYYSGGHNYCVDDNIPDDLEALGGRTGRSLTRKECLDYGGDWINSPLNFDNLLNSSISVFVISTGESWVDIMWGSFSSPKQNAVYFDKQIMDDFRMNGLFFILTLIIFNYFLVDLFTGVIVDAFYNQKQKTTGLIHLTKIQRDWVYLMFFILNFKPLNIVMHGIGKFQKFLLKFDTNYYKEGTIFIVYVGLLITWSFDRFGNTEKDLRIDSVIKVS